MKQPVLRIKKDAIVYDDTEAQRQSELPRPALPGSGPLVSRKRGRGRRGGPFTYLPLVVIAIGLFVLFQVLPNTPVSRKVISGWQVTLRVTPYQNMLIVGVTFIETRGNTPGAPNGQADVRASLPGTGAQISFAGPLDKSPMTLRGELPWLESAKRVQAAVTIGSQHVTLWVPAPAPLVQ